MFPGMIGCFFVPICMFWFGWSVRADVHFMVPIVGSGSFGIAAFSVFQGALPYLSDAYPDSVCDGGQGSAAIGVWCGVSTVCERHVQKTWHRLGEQSAGLLGHRLYPDPICTA